MTRFQRRVKQTVLRHGGRATCGDIADDLDTTAVAVAAAARRVEGSGDLWVRDEQIDGRKIVVVYNYNPDTKMEKAHEQLADTAGPGQVPV